MGFGWAEVSDKFLPPIIYNGETVFYPSSYINCPFNMFKRQYCEYLLHRFSKFNFQKVKAHSGIHFNQLADELAKQGLDIPPISTNPKFLPDAHMGLVRPH
uniref:Uncharacterized protein n=1 Tax=Rhizophagus irregularis (strain DAOM 181602 / DAOM 197198 / MUCL 43194) TaxID=747089 RepID=U9UPL4_RHIID